ncbi:MAG: hypothetical protein PHI12_06775 [Dehalococcoidales bacterium]|nr:hypothetical protein [Dehalococcoidales bacterium]
MRILRVFPRRTAFTPKDDLAFIGNPPLDRPEADEIHISCTFTWDKKDHFEKPGRKKVFVAGAETLLKAWSQYYPVVKLGGPAYGDRGRGEFVPGRYIRDGVTFTSRGCNNHCPWCLVEDSLRQLPLVPGNIINDDNFLQNPREHRKIVYEMLHTQSRIEFLGGLQSNLLTEWDVEQLRSLRIYQLFFACDTKGALKALQRVGKMLNGLDRRKARCYVLLAFNGQTISEAIGHLEDVWAAGFMPHAQLYQPPDHWIEYSNEWRELSRRWIRPAVMQTMDGKDFILPHNGGI